MTSGTTNTLYGVWGSSSTNVFAVGASGTILKYDGTNWSSLTSGTTNNLYSVWGSASNDVFAVGYGGTIVHYNGTAWSSQTSGTTNALYGVWGNSGSDVFAVGASGTILHYSSSWSSQTSGTTNHLYGVWGIASNDVFAVGYGGTILYYTTSWSSQTSGTTNTLYGVWGYSGSDVFAVGASGTILHYSSSWSSQTSGTTNTLYGVWEYSASNAFAVGICGTILKYNGTSWSSMTSPTTTLDQAITITATGSATYGVTIDGITFDRLRSGTVFNYAVYDQSADYITVQNCIFNYIYNRGIMLTSTNAAFTNGTISNNTFSNGGGSSPASTDAAIDLRASASYAISGITISGNTITNQKGKGIYLDGSSSYKVSSISITSNTITKPTSYGIQGYTYTDTVAITSNTITGCYGDGIDVKGTAYTIKKNIVTGNLGDGIDMELTSASHLINYNDIYNNTSYGVNVRSSVSTVNAKYNWWGSATGPTYTAATGASVDVSNPGGTGDNITDRVTYYEWLYKPKADVIADNAAYYSRAISLSVGWNTLSTPIILDASCDTINEAVDSAKMTIAYWYDTNDADSDGTYWEQVTTGYELEPCDAIYIKMNAAATIVLKYNATDLSTPTKALYDGWNLIGLANLESKHVDDAVQSVANTPTNLPGYSQVISPSMNSSDWTYSSGQSYTDEDMLVGEGYWIYMQNDCTLAGFTITPIQPSLD
jgi:parallel beta-helix repeat protein